jgi:hypothetical protein
LVNGELALKKERRKEKEGSGQSAKGFWRLLGGATSAGNGFGIASVVQPSHLSFAFGCSI